MIKALLPLAAALVLAPAMPALAQAVCYQDDAGNVVNLGSMCDRTEDRRTPVAPRPTAQPQRSQAPAVVASSNGFFYDVAATPFPSYLFDSDLKNEEAYLTGQESYGDSALFIYQGRFVKDFVQWPYTASSDNRAEWTYLDCNTGWLGLKESGFVDSGDTFFIPPALMSARDAYRSMCTAAGVQPRF